MRERTRSKRRSISGVGPRRPRRCSSSRRRTPGAGPRRPRRCSSSRRRTPGCTSRPRRRDRTRSAAGFRRRAAARRKSPARVGARRSLEALFHWRRALESSWELDSNTTAPASGDESVSESNAKVSRAKLFRWKSTRHGHHGPSLPTRRVQGPDNVVPVETRWQVYCDLDGVLADFERGVAERTKRQPKEFSRRRKMWRRLAPPRTEEFFARLDWMQGGAELWKYLEPLSPAILTGSPSGDWAGPQKVRWCEKNLKLPADRVLVVDASDKALFSHPGAILVDDRAEYRFEWEARGGIFIHCTDAQASIQMVQEALQRLSGPTSLRCADLCAKTVEETAGESEVILAAA